MLVGADLPVRPMSIAYPSNLPQTGKGANLA